MAVAPLLLTDADLRPLLADPASMDGATAAVEQATRLWAEGRVRQGELEDRTLGDPPNLMQLRLAVADGVMAGYQVFAEEASGDAPTLPNARFVTLLYPGTRQLLALMGYAALAPLRVGATACLACRLLAPAAARVAAIIGSGQQARTQLWGIWRALPGLRDVRVYSPTPEHREAFAQELAGWLGAPARPVASAEEAVTGADVVDVASSGYRHAIEMAWVRPGALVMPIGTRQMPPGVLAGYRVLATTWEHLAAREPYRTAVREGRFTRDHILGEFADVLLGRVAARRSPADTLVFELGRLNIWDVAVCWWAYRWARDRGVGRPFTLV